MFCGLSRGRHITPTTLCYQVPRSTKRRLARIAARCYSLNNKADELSSSSSSPSETPKLTNNKEDGQQDNKDFFNTSQEIKANGNDELNTVVKEEDGKKKVVGDELLAEYAPLPPEEEPVKLDSKTLDKRVWPIAASTLLMGTAIGIIIPIMPLYVSSIGLTPVDFGLIMSVMGISRLLVNIPIAVLADIVGRRPLLVLGPLGNMMANLGTGFSQTFFQLVSFRFTAGLSSACQMTAAHLYLSDISSPKNRARTLAPLVAAWSVGGTIGPAIGGFLAAQFGLQAPFIFVSVCLALITYQNYKRLPETLPVELKNAHLHTNQTTMEKISQEVRLALSQWRVLLKDKNIRLVVAMHTSYWFLASGAQLTLLPLLLVENFNITPDTMGGLFSLLAIANVIGSQPAAWWSDKIGRKKSIVPGAFIVASVVALIPFATSFTQLFFLVGAWGLGNSIIGTAPTAYLTDITDSRNRSQALALFRSGGDFGLLLGAGTSGFLAGLMGVGNTVIVNAAVLFSVACIFGLRSVEPRDLLKAREQTENKIKE